MNTTQNYNLKKPSYEEFGDVEVLNENADIIDNKLKELENKSENNTELINLKQQVTTHLAESNVGAHRAENIALEDVGGLFVATELEGAMKELFTNVSNGKQLVGTAITDIDASKVVPNNPTFQQIADLIRGISTGKRFATGTGTPNPTNGLVVNGLQFTPRIIIVKRVGSANQFNISTAVHVAMGNFKFSVVAGATGGPAGNNVNVIINPNGFVFKGIESGFPHDWIALEF